MKKKIYLALASLIGLCAIASCGEQGPKGDPGKDGSDGANGLNGKDGSDGSKIYTGSGAPSSSLGSTGDIYIDVDTGDMYSKGDSSWARTGNIKGDKGDSGKDGSDGKDGVGISSVVKTSSGSVDTYTVTYTDGSTYEFTVTNGQDGQPGVQGEKGDDGHTPIITIGENGDWYIDGQDTGMKAQGPQGDKGADGRSVASIEKTSSDGRVDTYTITYTDGSTSSFTVTNGEDGAQGIQGEPGTDGHTPTISIGENGDWFIDGVDSGISAKGEKGDAGVSVTKAYIDDNGDLICEMSDGTKINAGHVKDVTKHEVNFYVDDEIVETLSVEDGAKINAPVEAVTAGYTVRSWNCEEDGGYRWLFSAYTVNKDLDLYADFDYNAYNVTYVDGKYGTSIEPLTVTYDKPYSLSTIEDKTGWTFNGWKDSDGAAFANSGTYRLASDLTLYADWVANTYTVTLDPNKGTVSKTSVAVTYDSQYELPTPARENYVFLGWYDSSDKKVSSKATWKGTENATYTAKWTNIQNTYNFDAGDGTCDTYSMTIGWEDAYSLPTPETPSYDGDDGFGYLFLGWYLNGALIPQVGDSWTYSNSGGTLVAKYSLESLPSVDASAGTVSYGIYPQTRVSDEAKIASLNAVESAESNGWYLLDGEYYAKKEADPWSSSYAFDDGATIVSGTTYWFKCDPIEWKILSSDSGEYSLVSTALLDAHDYHSSTSSRTIGGKTVYPNNYEHSGIREWLNGDFYNLAFSLGDSCVLTTTVDNSASTTGFSSNPYACGNTEDKVYLLSYQDYKNASYFADDDARKCKTTDWARASGAYCGTDYNGWYWTRSPLSFGAYYACYVGSGDLYNYYDYVDRSDFSVRPSLRIKVAE